MLKTHVLKIIFYYHHQKHAQFIAQGESLAGNNSTALNAWSRIKAKINLIYELKFSLPLPVSSRNFLHKLHTPGTSSEWIRFVDNISKLIMELKGEMKTEIFEKIGCHMKFPIFVKYFEINFNCSGVSFVEMGKVGLRF